MDARALERIRRQYELFNEGGEFEADFFDPDVEWENAPELPGATVHRGRDAVLADLAAQDEAWEYRRVEPVEVLSAGDQAAVVLRLTAKGKASGVALEIEVVHVWSLADGRVHRVRAFLDRDAALRAAGLEPQSPSSER